MSSTSIQILDSSTRPNQFVHWSNGTADNRNLLVYYLTIWCKCKLVLSSSPVWQWLVWLMRFWHRDTKWNTASKIIQTCPYPLVRSWTLRSQCSGIKWFFWGGLGNNADRWFPLTDIGQNCWPSSDGPMGPMGSESRPDVLTKHRSWQLYSLPITKKAPKKNRET